MHILFPLLVFLLTSICTHAHIYSSESSVTYDYDGNPSIYHLFMSMETGLGATDYLSITMPLKIHIGSDKTKIKVKLVSFSNNLQIVSVYVNDYPVSGTDMVYYVTFGVALSANKWYQIQIYPNLVPSLSSLFYGLIQIQAISALTSNYITYDSNYAFRFLAIQRNLATTNTISLSTSSSSTSVNLVASIYTVNIDITPTNTLSTGGNFTISIYYDSTNSIHTASGTTLLDFTFMGLCQSVAPSTGTAAVLNYCDISDDLTSITFSVNSVTAGQPIRIQTQIQNPLYTSVRGLKVYYVDFVSGVVQENGYLVSAMKVNALGITDLGADRVYLLWGISTENTDSELLDLNLGLYKGTGTNVGPFNSFNAGFSFTQTSPIEGRYQVKMYLGAKGFLQGSIAHNLPSYSTLSVYCHYDTTTLYLVCSNVGPFININYRYFISGKVYYSSSSGSSVAGFGNVQIIPIVYTSDGTLLSSVSLYTALASGDTVPLIDSQQFLDTSGYHSTSTYKIGTAKIVSYQDDGSLSSTANAMKGFMSGTNSSVGIVPDLGKSQQLLLLMKVASISSSGSGNLFKMRLLYNSQAIGFETTDAAARGLDFVGYDSTNSVWSISYSPCYISNYVVCEKYSNTTPTANTQVIKTTTTNRNFYGLYKFNCAQSYSSTYTCYNGDCATACNLFTGYSTSNYGAGVMSMRYVKFSSTAFHSSVYADSNLLDFVVIFQRGSTFVSASLINAYTIVGAKMSNIKASYVNYYDEGSTQFNKGERVPTMLRIAGGVLPKQSRNATVIGVFFDDFVDAVSFYSSPGAAYDIGCSTGSCQYKPNTGVILPSNDIWHTMRRVQFYSLPPIQNQFNLLVPVTPAPSRYSFDSTPLPDTLTIAFFTQNYTVDTKTGLLQTVAVYRLFGPVVTSSISGSIGKINSMSRQGYDYFTSNGYFQYSNPYPYSLYYSLNMSNINESPPNNTFLYGYSGSFTWGGTYGCGITITSLYYNIFSSSTLAFEAPPANTASVCSIFGYVYNEQTTGNNLDRDGQWIYTAFCPIDSNMSLNNVDGNIQFYNPQYPNIFTKGFTFETIITYAISTPLGYLAHYKKETGSISTYVRSCTTSKMQAYNPSSSGKQRATFTVSTPQIRMAPAAQMDGFSTFRVIITLPSAITTITMQSLCDISNSDLSCSASGGSSSITLSITYTGTSTITVTYFQVQLYAVTSGTWSSTGDYTLTIYLPQTGSSGANLFGTSYSYYTTFCTCSSTFKVGNTAYGTTMVYLPPITTSLQKSTKSTYYLNFGSYDYRQAFFTTSYFLFNFGYLTEPSLTDKNNNNLRCMVYLNTSNVLTLSPLWKTLDLSSFSSISLSPKTTINQPNSYQFALGCSGSGVPSLSYTTSMSLSWMDNGNTVQSATSLVAPTSYYTTAASTTLSLSLVSKKFNTQGMKSFYTLGMTPSIALTSLTRIYINFHFRVSSRLDNQGYIQCYLRSGSTTITTYCQFSQDHQVCIWNNLIAAANTYIQIDIYNIQLQPSTDTSTKYITVSIDSDNSYTNGVAIIKTISDTTSNSVSSVGNIKILSTSVSTNYIRVPHTITIVFNTLVTTVIASATNVYLLLPGPYGEWITRGQTLSIATQCYMQSNSNNNTNILSACTFISKRILKMTVSSSPPAYNIFTIVLTGLYSPSKVPEGRYNQYRFKIFTSSTESVVQRYSFTDYSHYLTLTADSTLIDLSWKYYSIASSDSLLSLTDISSQTFVVYIGYFSNLIELRQSTYPSNFQQQMKLSLPSAISSSFIHINGTNIKLGDKNTYFRLAASTTMIAGLYTLQYSKVGDTLNLYTAVPPLTVVVSNKLCKLYTKQLSYTLPRNGYTVPILIDGINCLPLNNITITPVFSSAQVTMSTDLSSNVLKPTTVDGQLYLILKHNYVSLAISSVVTVTFVITGSESAYYDTIPSISLSIIDSSPYLTLPTVTALSAPSLAYNTATFVLQCNVSSKIYWGLGIYPSILNSAALDFEARVLSVGNGLTTNFTQPQDHYMRVYGINYVTTTQTLSKVLYNLKSNAKYIFKYYCINQMGLISDGQSYTFTSLNYGAYLMKVSIIFQGSITYQQYVNLACSIAFNFQVPYLRVMTEAMSVCLGDMSVFYQSSTDTVYNAANSNGQYAYNFYILPDYTIMTDPTNSNIRSALALSSTSTSIITSTTGFASLPEFIQMSTEDIQFFTTPTYSILGVISGLNSIVVTASITNMNGFIVIGCMEGPFDPATMTMPTSTNIKKGLLSTNVTLLQTKMIYVIQNYNVTLAFNSLTDNTLYTFFTFATAEDPSISALATTPNRFTATTLQALVVDINYGATLGAGLIAIFMLMMMV